MDIPKTLLKKYDVYGPRYTSYPTALQFNSELGIEDYYHHVEESNQDPIPKPLSLYLHIPFCKSLCYYCGCYKIITNNEKKAQDYLASLKAEIALEGGLFANDREVKQIHFGGGTPTYFQPEAIRILLDTIEQYFTLAPEAEREIGIEIDPRTTSEDDIKRLAGMGFNRMSFGVQDFDQKVQVAINRQQGRIETLQLLEAARQAGVPSISVDLIYGLPKQCPESFSRTLDAIITARPNRIALYNYAHMPQRIKAQKLIQAEDLPSAETKLELLTLSIKRLSDAGYEQIGMDHFSLPNDPLNQSLKDGTLHRNFQGYSTHGDCDIIGFGVSAISKIRDIFTQNRKLLKDYHQCIENEQPPIEKGYLLSDDDAIRAAVIQHIMCSETLNMSSFSRSYHINFKDYFEDELNKLKPMVDDQLVDINNDEIAITDKGRLLLRNIAMIFDAYLSNKSNKNNNLISFSKVL